MKHRNFRLLIMGVSAVAVLTGTTCWSFAAPATADAPQQSVLYSSGKQSMSTYIADVARIDGLDQARDLERYNRLALDFAKRYGKTQPAYEARIILHLVDHINLTDFGSLDGRRDQIERRWISNALDLAPNADFGIRAGLLSRLTNLPQPSSSSNPSLSLANRELTVLRWTSVWNDYQAFVATGDAWAGMTPPDGYSQSPTGYIPGLPDLATGGQIRIKEIRTVITRYDSADALKSWLPTAFEQGLVKAYSQDPRDSAGLSARLSAAGYLDADIARVVATMPSGGK